MSPRRRVRQGAGEPGPVDSGARGTILEGAMASDLGERVQLQVQALIFGRDAGVADEQPGAALGGGWRGGERRFVLEVMHDSDDGTLIVQRSSGPINGPGSGRVYGLSAIVPKTLVCGLPFLSATWSALND